MKPLREIRFPPEIEDACEEAIELAEASRKNMEKDGDLHPLVGAVLLDSNGRKLTTGSRRENGKSHAEVCAIEKLGMQKSKVHTVVTTLEPCCYRNNPDKICCAKRVVRLGAKQCIIGTLDPATGVRGRGAQILQMRDVYFTMFPRRLQERIMKVNREYVQFMSDLYASGKRIDAKEGQEKDDREFDFGCGPVSVLNYLSSKVFNEEAANIYKSHRRYNLTDSEEGFAKYFALRVSSSGKISSRVKKDTDLYELIASYQAIRPPMDESGAETERQVIYQMIGSWWYQKNKTSNSRESGSM